MLKAICENCGSLVEAELTHNGVCEVGHYVHCGWGHDLSPDELISDYAAYHIEELKGKLAKAMEMLEREIRRVQKIQRDLPPPHKVGLIYVEAEYELMLAELRGQDDENMHR